MHSLTSTAILLSFGYNLFFVPVSISYEYEPTHPMLLTLDLLAVLYYMVDLLVVSHTSNIDMYGNVNRSKVKILVAYSQNGLIFDMMAALPLDYIGLALGISQQTRAWFRLNRLLKVKRIVRLARLIHDHSQSVGAYGMLLVYLVLYIYLNHYAACLMFLIGKI
jgi:hypothetical protein